MKKRILFFALIGSMLLTQTSCKNSNSSTEDASTSPTATTTSSTIAVTGIALSETTLNLTVGGLDTLTATVSPSTATDKTVTWTSSDATKATVANGIITGVAAGTVTITAIAGTQTTTCTVTVSVPTTIADIDGNVYHTITIGTQVWMVENLKTTKYNDGTSIPNVTDATAWGKLTTGAYCNYNNDATNGSKYGKLYNWHAVNTGKLAPTGWHVPTDDEWTTLKNYLIAKGYNYDGTTTGNKIAKALAATTDWSTYSTTGTVGKDLSKNNSTGFSALPGGCRIIDGSFSGFNTYTIFWSSTSYGTGAWYWGLSYSQGNLYDNYDEKGVLEGCYVRCVKN
jgi:uncharacterized protein (TIGR02145 family)